MTKPRHRSDRRIAKRVLHELELRMRRRDERFRKELLDAVAQMLPKPNDHADHDHDLLDERITGMEVEGRSFMLPATVTPPSNGMRTWEYHPGQRKRASK